MYHFHTLHLEQTGYDTHSNMLSRLADNTLDLDDAIGAFVNEMKAQNLWDDVTVVVATGK